MARGELVVDFQVPAQAVDNLFICRVKDQVLTRAGPRHNIRVVRRHPDIVRQEVFDSRVEHGRRDLVSRERIARPRSVSQLPGSKRVVDWIRPPWGARQGEVPAQHRRGRHGDEALAIPVLVVHFHGEQPERLVAAVVELWQLS